MNYSIKEIQKALKILRNTKPKLFKYFDENANKITIEDLFNVVYKLQ